MRFATNSRIVTLEESDRINGSRGGKKVDTYEANVRVLDLPRRTDNILNALAKIHNRFKWELVRDALNEYAEAHKHELADIASS